MLTDLLTLPLDSFILLGTQTSHEIKQLKLQRCAKISCFLVHKSNGRDQIYLKENLTLNK